MFCDGRIYKKYTTFATAADIRKKMQIFLTVFVTWVEENEEKKLSSLKQDQIMQYRLLLQLSPLR